jgi:hypothetical protein
MTSVRHTSSFSPALPPFRSPFLFAAIAKTLQRYPQGLCNENYRSVAVSTVSYRRHIYFLVVGHMQCVGFWLPTQTLPWQNSISPVAVTLPAVSFVVLISGAFFLSTAYICFILPVFIIA